MERLIHLRQSLHTKLCDTLLVYKNSVLFNRRKVAALAEDIYILGYATINKLPETKQGKRWPTKSKFSSSE